MRIQVNPTHVCTHGVAENTHPCSCSINKDHNMPTWVENRPFKADPENGIPEAGVGPAVKKGPADV